MKWHWSISNCNTSQDNLSSPKCSGPVTLLHPLFMHNLHCQWKSLWSTAWCLNAAVLATQQIQSGIKPAQTLQNSCYPAGERVPKGTNAEKAQPFSALLNGLKSYPPPSLCSGCCGMPCCQSLLYIHFETLPGTPLAFISLSYFRQEGSPRNTSQCS